GDRRGGGSQDAYVPRLHGVLRSFSDSSLRPGDVRLFRMNAAGAGAAEPSTAHARRMACSTESAAALLTAATLERFGSDAEGEDQPTAQERSARRLRHQHAMPGWTCELHRADVLARYLQPFRAQIETAIDLRPNVGAVARCQLGREAVLQPAPAGQHARLLRSRCTAEHLFVRRVP